MTVPTLPIAMTDIKAEFGGSGSTPLSAYVKGGAYVPIQTLADIPGALPINMSDFAGAVYPAAVAFMGASVSNGFTVATAVVAADLSTATIVLTRTKTVNGGTSWSEASSLDLAFSVSGAIAPSIVIRLPAAQPRDGAGYWKQISASDFKRVTVPGSLVPTEDYTTFEHYWRARDVNTTYQGELRINTLIPLGNDGAPPQRDLVVTAGAFTFPVTIAWSMDVGTAIPPYSGMSWNTRNISNTYVEFPVVLDVYDGGVLKASYDMLLHVEINATTTFNPS